MNEHHSDRAELNEEKFLVVEGVHPPAGQVQFSPCLDMLRVDMSRI